MAGTDLQKDISFLNIMPTIKSPPNIINNPNTSKTRGP
jgi:hypothetical protein